MKSQIDKLLEKLKKNSVDNDLEFLKCFIDLDDRLKERKVFKLRKLKKEV